MYDWWGYERECSSCLQLQMPLKVSDARPGLLAYYISQNTAQVSKATGHIKSVLKYGFAITNLLKKFKLMMHQIFPSEFAALIVTSLDPCSVMYLSILLLNHCNCSCHYEVSIHTSTRIHLQQCYLIYNFTKHVLLICSKVLYPFTDSRAAVFEFTRALSLLQNPFSIIPQKVLLVE